jgi:hypothetical protein
VEVLVAVVLVAVALVPALEALQTGILGASVHATLAVQQRHLTSKMEEVLAQPFGALALAGAAAAGGPTSYSDAPSSPDRRLVYLDRWDGDNADLDDDPLTGTDDDLLRVRVEIEASALALETLTTL